MELRNAPSPLEPTTNAHIHTLVLKKGESKRNRYYVTTVQMKTNVKILTVVSWEYKLELSIVKNKRNSCSRICYLSYIGICEMF